MFLTWRNIVRLVHVRPADGMLADQTWIDGWYNLLIAKQGTNERFIMRVSHRPSFSFSTYELYSDLVLLKEVYKKGIDKREFISISPFYRNF